MTPPGSGGGLLVMFSVNVGRCYDGRFLSVNVAQQSITRTGARGKLKGASSDGQEAWRSCPPPDTCCYTHSGEMVFSSIKGSEKEHAQGSI